MKPDLIWKCDLKESKINRNVLNKSNDFFKQKESLDRVMYSVLRVKTSEQAYELHTQIEEMESSFSDLVSEYSIGTEKKFNGIGKVFKVEKAHCICTAPFTCIFDENSLSQWH